MPKTKSKKTFKKRHFKKSKLKKKLFASNPNHEILNTKQPKIYNFVFTDLAIFNVAMAGGSAPTSIVGTLPNISEYLNLFHEYKIKKVNIRFQMTELIKDADNYQCILYVGQNPPNQNVAPSMNNLEQYKNVHRWTLTNNNTGGSFTWYPKINNPYLASGLTFSYGSISSSKRWLSTDETDILHYGFYYYVPFLPPSNIQFDYEFHLAFRYPK